MCTSGTDNCAYNVEKGFRDKDMMQNSQTWFRAYFPFLKKENVFMTVSNLSIFPPPLISNSFPGHRQSSLRFSVAFTCLSREILG
jgi:hypothetical protein